MSQLDARPRPGRSSSPLMIAGRRVLHGYGTATARWRPLPEFLVIGAKRGGSTSFYFDLLEHDCVCPLFPRPDHLPKGAPTKGIHYFDQNFDRGERWYRSHLPSTSVRERQAAAVGAPVITGEASPYYLFHPAAAERAASTVPQAKIIAVLRDPAQRAYSHWKERRRNGLEELDFEAALAAEAERVGDVEDALRASPTAYSYAHEQLSYAAQSEYAPALARWYDNFPAEQILVFASEDYYSRPEIVLDEVQDFLGLPRRPLGSSGIRNAAEGKGLEPRTAAELAERFAPANRSLVELTDRSFPWAGSTSEPV